MGVLGEQSVEQIEAEAVDRHRIKVDEVNDFEGVVAGHLSLPLSAVGNAAGQP
jgi:hypothetical protein